MAAIWSNKSVHNKPGSLESGRISFCLLFFGRPAILLFMLHAILYKKDPATHSILLFKIRRWVLLEVFFTGIEYFG